MILSQYSIDFDGVKSLRVEHESARAQFGTRVTRFFEDQDTGGKMRGDPLKMQGGGESRGSAAYDEDIVL